MKLLVFYLALAISCPALSDVIRLERAGDGWNITVSGSLPPQPFFRITAGGDLTVRGKTSPEIRYAISGHLRGGDEAAARHVAEEYRVHNVAGQLFFPQPAAVRVELPRRSSYLSLWTPGGAIDAADLDGSVRADSSAGRIMLDRIGGDAEVHSAGGATMLGSIGGVVRCYSGGGAIRAVRVQGSATFQSGGGDIQLGEVMGPVRAVTAAGGIRIDHAGGTVYADTFGGPISILDALGDCGGEERRRPHRYCGRAFGRVRERQRDHPAQQRLRPVARVDAAGQHCGGDRFRACVGASALRFLSFHARG